MKWAIILIALTLAGGCTPKEKLPTYPRLTAEQSRMILSARAHRVRTLSAQGTITLTKPDKQSIRFEGALVMQPPDLARLRAWKFNQAVFDLTLIPDGVYLVIPNDPEHKQDLRRAGDSASEFARTFADLTGRFFDNRNLRPDPLKETDSVLFLTRTNADGSTLSCRIDRTTLTPRRYVLTDAGGKERFSLALDNYTLLGGFPFARRLIATSDTGTIQVDLRDVELNAELPGGAFVPPRRAEKIGGS